MKSRSQLQSQLSQVIRHVTNNCIHVHI